MAVVAVAAVADIAVPVLAAVAPVAVAVAVAAVDTGAVVAVVAVVVVAVTAVTVEIAATVEIIAAGGNHLHRPGGERFSSACHASRLGERSGLEDVVELIRVARRAEVALQSAHGELLDAAVTHQHVARVVMDVPLPACGALFQQGRDAHKLG